MSLAMLVVTGVRVEQRTVSEVARTYGVSRQWVYVLLRRYDQQGETGLLPRSRRPHSSPAQTSRQVEDEIVRLRKELDDQGLDAGAATIAAYLERTHGTAPAVSTIWRILTRRGFVTPQPQKRPRSSIVRFEADQPNQRWQTDITHWQLEDTTDVEILNVLDDHSRVAVASQTLTTFKAPDVVDVFHDAFTRYGLPASVLCDNAAVFAGAPRGHGRVALEKTCDLLQIRVIHSRAYHPQTCGKVERFHQTLKKWLRAHDPAPDLATLQAQLDQFLDHYNTRRPHRALHRRTPIEAWNARPHASPAGQITPTHYRLRRDTIDTSGCVTLRHNSRLHHIGIGRLHAGTRILLLVADLHIRVITHDGQLLRELTLDPTRDYQPQGVKPGPQPRDKHAQK